MFENFRVFETEFAGRKMSFETGKMCCQAGGSVLVSLGNSGRMGRSTTRADRMACSPGRPSRRIKLPGRRPAAINRYRALIAKLGIRK